MNVQWLDYIPNFVMYLSALLAVYVSLWPNKHKKPLLILSCIFATVSLILSMRSKIDDEIYKEKLTKSLFDQRNEILKTREQSEKLFIELTEANKKLDGQNHNLVIAKELSQNLQDRLIEANKKLDGQTYELTNAKEQNGKLQERIIEANKKLDGQNQEFKKVRERRVLEEKIESLKSSKNKIFLYEYKSIAIGGRPYYSYKPLPYNTESVSLGNSNVLEAISYASEKKVDCDYLLHNTTMKEEEIVQSTYNYDNSYISILKRCIEVEAEIREVRREIDKIK